MSSDGASPWKTSSSTIEKNEGTSQDSRNFPPLNAKGPSKAQRRTRALYTQSATFEPYPPRIEQTNRQKLSRVDSSRHDGYLEDDDTWQEEIDRPSYTQQSGISSVTFYSEDGHRLSTGPDIYIDAIQQRGTL